VPGHESIAGNERADLLARTGFEHPFIGLEPASGISTGVAMRAVKDWSKRNHKKQWESTTGLKQTNRALCQKNEGSVGVKQRPIKMSGRTGHCHLKGQLFKLGLKKMNQPHISYVTLKP
jgi:hypothetical protein